MDAKDLSWNTTPSLTDEHNDISSEWTASRTDSWSAVRLDASTCQYNTIRKKSLTWTQKLSDQLNLAHVARKNMKKKKLKQTNGSAQLVQNRFKICEDRLEYSDIH